MRRLKRAHQRDAREQAKRRKKFKQKAIAAGAAAAITLGVGVSLNKALAHTPDIHELPVSKDADWDLLADKEEITIGYPLFNPDQNRNEIPDGVELAKRCFTDVNNLPVWSSSSGKPEPNEPYKTIIAAAFGIETCEVCGKNDIVMILWEVVNPKSGVRVRLTDMGMHYLEHGSFTYHSLDDWSGRGRLDVPALAQALELPLPYEPNDHKLPVAEDADADLLSNKEEFAIGYQIYKPDQNRNEINDGTDLAMCCAAAIEQLPEFEFITPPGIKETHKIRYLTDGTETCEMCPFTICMDHWDIVNPSIGMTVSLPVMAAHYMEHGSFSYAATYHNGRAHIAQLLRVLELRFPQYWNGHLLPLDYILNILKPGRQLAPDANDLDGDLLADSEELAAGYNLYDPDQDQDLTSDGIELANQCAVAINGLPLHDTSGGSPAPKETYKVEHIAKGNETCHICAAEINMGFVEIINPQLESSIVVPFMSVHYIGHGSFSYAGSSNSCLLYTSPSPRDRTRSRMPSSA